MTEATADTPTTLDRTRKLAHAAWRAESAVWLSVWRFASRRPRVPAGATGFRYHSPILTILIVFIVLSAIEIPIIDLIVHPWPWVRIPLLILGIWGLTWMLGLLLGFVTRPHSVGPDGIRARFGPDIDVDLPWSAVASVERSRDIAEKAPKIRDEAHGRTLALRMQNETNILIVLERPVTARVAGTASDIDAVRLWADDPAGFLSAVRTHIP
ncbi:hypothetical protein ASD65_02090 [Microbacterium sp. Root61]|uniref:hypothetical protein n=1 Tax=Microbacterium sp. Root61 TaxID=1736570 RepID=UPI0006F87677|nr:hypothetical protein [Microbacterium sp. Root61]KRA23341.1 hypothetical protein ASD65_02090 [Microbacterium sp. Root61]